MRQRFVWDDGCYKHLAPVGAKASPLNTRSRRGACARSCLKLSNKARATSLPNLRACGLACSQLHAVAKSITNRQNLCAQLRMIDEVLVKLTQRFRRWLLIRRSNLAGNLTAPQEIVAEHHATRTQLW